MELKNNFYRVGDILKAIMEKNKKIGSIIKQNSVLNLWHEIIGPEIEKKTEPICIKGGTLYIKTESSTLANELSFREHMLKSRINSRIGELVVKKIVYRSGQVIKKKKKGNKQDMSVKKILNKNTIIKIKKACQNISDPELKIIMEKFLRQIASKGLIKRVD